MAAREPSRRARIARVAARRRWHPDDPALDLARRDVAVESLDDHIRRVVEPLPPLTDAQVGRLVGLLYGAGAQHVTDYSSRAAADP